MAANARVVVPSCLRRICVRVRHIRVRVRHIRVLLQQIAQFRFKLLVGAQLVLLLVIPHLDKEVIPKNSVENNQTLTSSSFESDFRELHSCDYFSRG